MSAKDSEYCVKATCHVCGKAFLARYNVGDRAKVCTVPAHVCKPVTRKGKRFHCGEKCCRSQYARGAASAAMNNAIDPRKVLSESEYAKAIKASLELPNPAGITIRFLANTGCRCGEALLVRTDSIQWRDGPFSVVKIVTLKRPGRPVRDVHIKNGTAFGKELRVWHERWKKSPGTLFDIPKRTLQRWIERILKTIKPDRASLAHIFRHTRVSRLLAAGATLDYVRHQAGWSSLEMLKIYGHTSEDRIAKVLDRV